MATIKGRRIDAETIPTVTNCRLRKTREELARLLAMVEDEMEARMGKGGGGLTHD